MLVFRVLRERQVRHGDELQAAVVNAKNFVALEVELLGVAADLLVAGGIAKAQIAVCRLQLQQVLGDPLPVGGAQGTDRNHHGRLLLVNVDVRGRRAARYRAQHVPACAPGCLEPVFGCVHVGKYKGYPSLFPVKTAAPQQNSGPTQNTWKSAPSAAIACLNSYQVDSQFVPNSAAGIADATATAGAGAFGFAPNLLCTRQSAKCGPLCGTLRHMRGRRRESPL